MSAFFQNFYDGAQAAVDDALSASTILPRSGSSRLRLTFDSNTHAYEAMNTGREAMTHVVRSRRE